MLGTDGDSTGEYPGNGIDLATRLRRRVLPQVHRLVAPVGCFATCRQHPDEYVGTVYRELPNVRPALTSMSFTPEPIASLKIHDDGRKSVGSWVRRHSPFAEKQLHVSLFHNGRDAVDVFAHNEYSWLTHPYRHYTGVGWDITGGVSRMRSLLTDHDVAFVIE